MNKIEGILQPFVENQRIAGAVAAAADKNATLDTAAVGWADIAAQEPMRLDTLFWVASQTKPITGTALMMLVEEGRVHLDAPAEDYLPVLKELWVTAEQDDAHKLLQRPTRPVTVRDLLRHTSGMPFKSALEQPTLDRFLLKDRVQSYAMTPLDSQPGSRYEYSNAGINTAGQIIEAVSGLSYEAFLQQRLFDPLDMTDTTFRPTAQQISRLAKSYKPNDALDGLEEIQIDQLQYPLDDLARQPMPAGGLFSTAPDLVRFFQMILCGGQSGSQTYLSPDSILEMTRRQTSDALEASYGLGWGVSSNAYGHGGAYSTETNIHRAQGILTIYLVQHNGFLLDGDQAKDAFVTAALEGHPAA